MRSFTPRLLISRRQTLAVVAYVGIVIGLLAVALLLVADLRDKLAEVAVAEMRLDQLSGRSPPSFGVDRLECRRERLAVSGGANNNDCGRGATATRRGGGRESGGRSGVVAGRTRRPRRQERIRRPNVQRGARASRPCRRSFTTSRQECHIYSWTNSRSSRLKFLASLKAGVCE